MNPVYTFIYPEVGESVKKKKSWIDTFLKGIRTKWSENSQNWPPVADSISYAGNRSTKHASLCCMRFCGTLQIR